MGTGHSGMAALRALIAHPPFDVVGVYVCSDQKAGRDAGELCGTEPTGIVATSNVEDIVTANPDCVVHMPMTYHPEPGLEFVEHARQRRDVVRVTREHVMRDRDPVARAQQPEHHLRPVRTMITRVAERTRREPIRRTSLTLEIRRGQVVTHETEIEVREIGEPTVQVRLRRPLRRRDRNRLATAYLPVSSASAAATSWWYRL